MGKLFQLSDLQFFLSVKYGIMPTSRSCGESTYGESLACGGPEHSPHITVLVLRVPQFSTATRNRSGQFWVQEGRQFVIRMPKFRSHLCTLTPCGHRLRISLPSLSLLSSKSTDNHVAPHPWSPANGDFASRVGFQNLANNKTGQPVKFESQ